MVGEPFELKRIYEAKPVMRQLSPRRDTVRVIVYVSARLAGEAESISLSSSITFLRAAQVERWKQWQSPDYRAAFTLQGEWRETSAVSLRNRGLPRGHKV